MCTNNYEDGDLAMARSTNSFRRLSVANWNSTQVDTHYEDPPMVLVFRIPINTSQILKFSAAGEQCSVT